jgi:Na+/phosphate symporter
MSIHPVLKEHSGELETIVGKLVAGTGAARDAFNRHSRSSMEELRTLNRTAAQELEAALQKLQARLAGKSAGEQAALTRLSGIYSHLQIIANNLGALADPIQKKIKDGVLFSDKAVSQTNYLFDTQAGMLRSVLDIIKTDNEFLKRYTETEARNLIQACNNFATEHETRLIEGLCQPQAAPLFLAILDSMRIMGRHETEIVQLLL